MRRTDFPLRPSPVEDGRKRPLGKGEHRRPSAAVPSQNADLRRECDWDPTISEFAIILLGGVRLGSTCCVENTRELLSVVCNLSPTRASATGIQLAVACESALSHDRKRSTRARLVRNFPESLRNREMLGLR